VRSVVLGSLLLCAVSSLTALGAHAEEATAPAPPPLEAAESGVGETAEEGLWLSASLQGALLARDVWAGASLGVGVELDALALHLRAPLYLSVADLEPARDNDPPVCAFVRCAEWLEDGDLRLEAMSRLVESLRLGRPGDWLHAEGGPVLATLGHGRLVDRYSNGPQWDRRQSGIFASARAPFAGLALDVVVGNLFVPQKLAAARLEARPLAPLVGQSGFFARALSRLRVGVDGGGDLIAPAFAPGTRAIPQGQPPAARPVGGASVDVAWPLLEEGGLLGLEPFVAAGLLSGLSADGLSSPSLGVGASAGLELEVRLPVVALRAEASVRADGPAHRTGLFGLLYELERRRAIFGAALHGAGLVHVPAPGGVGGAASAELVLLDVLRLGARGVKDTAPGASFAELFGEAQLFGGYGSARVIRRGLDDVNALIRLDEGWIAVAEAGARVWGPVSVFARWYHAPRTDPVSGALRVDDDVIVGVSGDLVFGFARDPEG
jgi:hypothetical protein